RDFVAAIVPAHAKMRVVTAIQVAPGQSPVAASCDPRNSGPAYWWFVYILAPRASVCDENARWTVYLGVAPPAGGTVYRFGPTYAVVRR
ncbi:MAG: hypothetical protein M3Y44_11900, partial [Actinomycetota bacterium]|nr:hypothetical protein [Actinomycetota bacterium]